MTTKTVPLIIQVLAEWEEKNGALSLAMPDEHDDICRLLKTASLTQSPRQARDVCLVPPTRAVPDGWAVNKMPSGSYRVTSPGGNDFYCGNESYDLAMFFDALTNMPTYCRNDGRCQQDVDDGGAGDHACPAGTCTYGHLLCSKIANPAEPARAVVDAVSVPRGLLKKLIDHADRSICYHEETERLGAIWSKCNQCGGMFADDSGGVPVVDRPDWLDQVSALLAAAPAEGK